MRKDTYIYSSSAAEELRLGILNEVYNPAAKATLLDLNIKEKKSILEVACGQGELACWIAEITPAAEVVGIDISDEQLDFARRKARERGLTNLKFIKLSALDIEQLPAILGHEFRPELIYCRWLLCHLTISFREQVMVKLYEILGSGGVMIHEELSLRESLTSESTASYKHWVELFERLAAILEIDFDIGAKLFQQMIKICYQKVSEKRIAPLFSANQYNFFNLDLSCSAGVLQDLNVINSAELISLQHRLDSEINDQTYMVNYQVWGFK
ncbi:MAG: Methyltransferase type 11 [Burkholderiales bacterium]|nr:Methyltransferase type 11 [Burkholderiales bacterium]